MATKEKGKAVKVPHGTPIPEGQDLDTSDYVNEVGPYDDDITKHPQYHENAYVGSQEPQLAERVEQLKAEFSEAPEDIHFERRVNTRSGLVTVTLEFPDGDKFGGQGPTTAEAITALETKLVNKRAPVTEVTK
jgi:hypothetical protein